MRSARTTRLVVTALVLLNAVVLGAVVSSSASGHRPGKFYAQEWRPEAKVGYVLDRSMKPRRTQRFVRRADAQWDNRSGGRGPAFVLRGVQQIGGPFSPCRGPNAVFRDYMGPDNGFPDGILGFTPGCVSNGGRRMVGFSMVINSRYRATYRKAGPPAGSFDGPAVLTHEFGHATGWYGHYDTGSSQCDKRGAYQTMCPIWRPNRARAWRTLGRHDKHTINAAYRQRR